MSTAFPIERSDREETLTATAGQTVFNLPATIPLLEAADLTVAVKPPGATFFSTLAPETVAVNLGAGTVTIAAQLLNTQVRLRGSRTHHRLTDVVVNGAVRAAPLERELDATALVLQELRRDAGVDQVDLSQTAAQASIAASVVSTTQAGIATTQAGIATTQAGISTTQAGISTTQAGIATAKAGEAAASALAADASKTAAGVFEDGAEYWFNLTSAIGVNPSYSFLFDWLAEPAIIWLDTLLRKVLSTSDILAAIRALQAEQHVVSFFSFLGEDWNHNDTLILAQDGSVIARFGAGITATTFLSDDFAEGEVILIDPLGAVVSRFSSDGSGGGAEEELATASQLEAPADLTLTAGSGATATSALSGAGVGSVTVTAPGTGYNRAPLVVFSGGGGTGAAATATVATAATSAARGVTGVTVTAPGTGYSSAPTVSFTAQPPIDVAAWPVCQIPGKYFLTASRPTIALLLIFGQSLALRASNFLYTTGITYPGTNFMLNGVQGVRAVSNQPFSETGLTDAVEVQFSSYAESGAVAMMNTIATMVKASVEKVPLLGCIVGGAGGTSVRGLGRQSAPYKSLLFAVQRFVQFARAAGYDVVVPLINIVHGNEDYGSMSELEQIYNWINFRHDLEYDLRRLTGQKEHVLAYFDQPDSVVTTAGYENGVNNAMLNITNVDPLCRSDAVHMDIERIGHVEAPGTDFIHPSSLGYMQMGERSGRTIALDWLYGGSPPFKIIEARQRSATEIDLHINVPEPPLVLDTSNNFFPMSDDPAYYGIEVYSTAGVAQALHASTMPTIIKNGVDDGTDGMHRLAIVRLTMAGALPAYGSTVFHATRIRGTWFAPVTAFRDSSPLKSVRAADGTLAVGGNGRPLPQFMHRQVIRVT